MDTETPMNRGIRVLKAVDMRQKMEVLVEDLSLRQKMEALVEDLSHALEESAGSSLPSRRRWGLRRRARSTGNLPMAFKGQSDDSSSSIGDFLLPKDKGVSSIHQSDSDDMSPSPALQHRLSPLSLQSRKAANSMHRNFVESDSVNENFSPIRPSTKRKRKFKRMAVDPDPNNPSTSGGIPIMPLLRVKKKRIFKLTPTNEYRYNTILCGKRKRSMRERSMECEHNEGSRSKSSRILAFHKMSLNEDFNHLDGKCEIMSSSSLSSLSSSESDTGIYTNDEGREADDEQSDWFGEPGSAYGIPGEKTWWDMHGDGSNGEGGGAKCSNLRRVEDDDTDWDDQEDDATFKAILTGSFEHLSEEAKMRYREKVKWIANGLNGREIRGGRRRVRGEKPPFSITTSANEKLSRFLQDSAQSELRLHPMEKQERDQLCHLASLYSLKMNNDSSCGLSCPVLTKTRYTTQAVKLGQVSRNGLQSRLKAFNDYKRRRRVPPSSPQTSHMEMMAESPPSPIPESNIGNQMLRSMGWEPGTGLGPDGSGIHEPIASSRRAMYQGLGYSSNYRSS